MKFIGREYELSKLRKSHKTKQARIIAFKGRRRIGKSRLAEEFASDKIFFSFSGIAPIEGVTDQTQRNTFAQTLASYNHLPQFACTDWNDAFTCLLDIITDKPTVILLDEISWMAAGDPSFIPKLKNLWDLHLSKQQNITLILCGSVSTWIEENIINSTAFFGRISLVIDLTPLSIAESTEFLRERGFRGSHYEILKILSITGGVPWYLEQISPTQTADDNIKALCFEKDGILTTEFNRIFNDLFNGASAVYKRIIEALTSGAKTLSDVRDKINYPQSGTLSILMQNLITAGFVTKHYIWSIDSGKLAKQSLYRLSDCYTRFYVKHIEPHMPKIESGTYIDLALSELQGWDSIMGLQVENLLLQNRSKLLQMLNIKPSDIMMDGPYIQHQTTRYKACQIDYLVQTHSRNLFICEFKFNRRVLGGEIITEMKERIHTLHIPRGFAAIPVLVQFGGVTESVYTSNYFYKIVDIGNFLDCTSSQKSL